MTGRPKVRAESLNRQAIIGAALRLARDGIDNLTMRLLAEELQVSVGAVYKHVSGRDELLDLVVDHVLEQVPRLTEDSGDGWTALRDQVLGTQAMMDRYPGIDAAVIARSPRSPRAMKTREEGMAALQREGLTADEAHKVYRATTWLWVGARTSLGGRRRRQVDIDTFTEALDILIAGLRQHIELSHKESIK